MFCIPEPEILFDLLTDKKKMHWVI